MMMAAPKIATTLTPVSSDSGESTPPERSGAMGTLVLARQVGQSIVIGDAIRVEVISLRPGSARLRFVAPRSIPVHRREVYDLIRLSREVAPAPGDLAGNGITDALTGDAQRESGLVLSRRVGETTMIGDSIAVEVVDARAGTVRLRVIAPRSISVHRDEVYRSIRAEAQA